MKRLAVLLSALALAVVGVTGCSGSKSLPTNFLETKTSDAETYATTNCSIQIQPAEGSKAESLANYLDREDCIYIDARDIGSYTKEHIEGFECIPFFELVYGEGQQLYKKDFTARYQESAQVLKSLIPEGRNIILMCQSGGRIVSLMRCMKAAGYDMSKVYNVGGYNHVNALITAKTNTLPISVGKAAVKSITCTWEFNELTAA